MRAGLQQMCVSRLRSVTITLGGVLLLRFGCRLPTSQRNHLQALRALLAKEHRFGPFLIEARKFSRINMFRVAECVQAECVHAESNHTGTLQVSHMSTQTPLGGSSSRPPSMTPERKLSSPERKLSSRVTLRMRASGVSMLPAPRGTWTTGTLALASGSPLSDGFGRADSSVV